MGASLPAMEKMLKLGLFEWRWKWALQVCGAMSRDSRRQWLAEVLDVWQFCRR